MSLRERGSDAELKTLSSIYGALMPIVNDSESSLRLENQSPDHDLQVDLVRILELEQFVKRDYKWL